MRGRRGWGARWRAAAAAVRVEQSGPRRRRGRMQSAVETRRSCLSLNDAGGAAGHDALGAVCWSSWAPVAVVYPMGSQAGVAAVEVCGRSRRLWVQVRYVGG